ncbi:peptidylprolyl isomerase [Haloactinopolyspora alba]|uniref:Peptidyl-prolyl cis-trans isomerase n=1 Tax=Haloactinopolyspora alba TaxID=648780 RepID=A0A2P8D9H0_9ACTN|nr:FKBP-type peptidyl-prolyl cis-trans isomerase [Haloactinopolyspora alba]PSK93852.1 peptidylprolyl isomerase [Haloactinopolyspora alba]
MLERPEVDFPEGPLPQELEVTDLVVGDGDEAVPGSTLLVHYAGVDFESGEEFDASWNRGKPVEVPLRGLIEGWQVGVQGMRIGGRRKLVIPPHQAYGPAGNGHRLAGRTLIFVIDLLAVSQQE